MSRPSLLPSFHDGQEILVGPDGLPDSVPHFFVCDVVFVRDAEKNSKVPHICGLYLLFDFSGQGPRLTCVEDTVFTKERISLILDLSDVF